MLLSSLPSSPPPQPLRLSQLHHGYIVLTKHGNSDILPPSRVNISFSMKLFSLLLHGSTQIMIWNRRRSHPPLEALLIACHIVGEGARNSTRVYMTFQCGYQSSRAIARGAGLKFNCNFRNSRITLLCAECKERQINFAFCFCSSQWQCTRKKKSAQHKASGEAKKKTAQIVAK